MKKRIKYNGEIHIFDVSYTFFENGKHYAVTKKNRLYRLRYDILNGVSAEKCTEDKFYIRDTLMRANSLFPETHPLDGEHYVMRDCEFPERRTKCPLFDIGHRAAAAVFRLMLLLCAAVIAYFLFCKGGGISFAEALFPSLSLKRLKVLVFAVEIVGSLVIFFIKGDNTDVFDIVNCACLPVGLLWGAGAVKSSVIIAVGAPLVLVVSVYLYVFPLISERIHEKRPIYKKEITRDIAAQSVYALSLCLAACIFGTSLLGITGYSDKVEYSKKDNPEVNYLEMLGELKRWDELDVNERLDVLSNVHCYEAKRLGIDGVTLCVTYPSDVNEYGAYNPITNGININRTRLEEGGVLELIDTVIHETRHVYQKHLADAYTEIEDSLDEKYKSLFVFIEAKTFRDNTQNYIDKGLDYYCQPLEFDAREYAAERIKNTYEKVLNNTYYFE